MINKLKMVRLPLVVLSAFVFFLGERYLVEPQFVKFSNWGAVCLMLIAAGITGSLIFKAQSLGHHAEKKSFFLALLWKASFLLGFFAYMAYGAFLGDRPVPETFLTKFLLGAWLSLLLFGFFLALGLEIAFQRSGTGQYVDFHRIKRSALSWLSVGILLGTLVGMNYFGAVENKVFDLTYLKVTQPSSGSLEMVKNIDSEFKIGLFYPLGNEVRPLVSEYIEALAENEGQLKVEYFDKETDPETATKYKVSSNGKLVLNYKEQTERINIGLTLKSARKNLKKLDQLFQNSFTKLIAKKKTAYFTASHGEMTFKNVAFSKDKEKFKREIKGLQAILKSQNITVKSLEGSASLLEGVPDDASLVAVVGPTRPFLKEEVDALATYLESGGSLVVLLDDDYFDERELLASKNYPLIDLLKEYGITYYSDRLANDRQFVSNTKSKADKWFLYSNIFSPHKATEQLSKHDQKVQVLFLNSGHLGVKELPGWKLTPIIKSYNTTYADKNRNMTKDNGEESKSFTFVAVAEKKSGTKKSRLLVSADASVFSDFLLNNVGNQVMVFDALRFASGDDFMARSQVSEEDIKIIHSRDEHLAVFYGSVFFVPSILLLSGFLVTRSRRFERKDS